MADRWSKSTKCYTCAKRVSTPSDLPRQLNSQANRGYNDTYVWGPDFKLCPTKYNMNASQDLPRCVTYRGGTYDPTKSGTDTDVEDGKAHGFDEVKFLHMNGM
jgi:hypothetical protein